MRILLLEDNPADAELIEHELRGTLSGFVLKRVDTGEDFSKELLEFSPDLILSDYDLPRYSGILALSEAKKTCPDVPFILVTGAVTEDRAIEVLTSGARDYVLKNRLHRLVPAVQRALAEAEEHKARRKAEEELRETHRNLEERVKLRTAELEVEMAARTKMEEALRENERREHERAKELAAILDAVPTPVIIVHDPDGIHMTGNRAANELLRISRGTEASLSAPPESKPHHFRAMKDGRELRLDELPAQRAARGEHVRDFEFSLIFNDSTTFTLLGYGTPLLDARGYSRGAVHVLVDVTERKQAEEALRKSMEHFQSVLENSRDAIYRVNVKTGRFEYISPSAQAIGGFSSGELMGQASEAAQKMIHPDDLSAMQAALALLEETGQAEAEYRQRTRGGDYRWVSNHMKLTRDDAGRPLYRDGNIRDVTDRKKTEEQLEGSISQLELANKELESFSYSVSHDLRAPLRAIDGFSSMLMKTLEGKLDQEERRRFDLIRDNTKKMNHLIEDLLALSRAGRFELTLKKIDLNKLVNSVWKQEQEAHPEIAVALKTGDLPEAVGDRSLLWQVFSNLLANAVKFTRKRKKAVVEVGGEIRDTENIYYVKDNGTGFDMKYYEKLFGVFQRLHPENEYEGTGVGLAIVQRIIHRHGGRIWAEGKVGKGATFYFSLPAKK